MIDLTLFARRGGVALSSAALAALAACGGGAGSTADTAGQQNLLLAETTSATQAQTLSAATTVTTVAKSVNAASCGFNDVQAAVKSASSGMTVQIPAGSCSWGTQQLNVPAGVYLRGAGQDATVISRVGAVGRDTYLVAYDCSNGKVADFSAMTLVGNRKGSIQDSGLGLLKGCAGFKVTASTFKNFVHAAVYVGDAANQRGVIAQNRFVDNYSPDLKDLGFGVLVSGGGAWPALSLGSVNAVYVEDNSFSGNRQSVSSTNGASYVFRYNTIAATDATKDFYMTDVQGLSSATHGTRSYEIYANTYQASGLSGLARTAIGVGGGDGVIFNNVIPATISRGVEISTAGFTCGKYPGADQVRSLYIWGNTIGNTSYASGGIANNCPSSVALNRDYFLTTRTGYTAYAYPHPARALASPGPGTSTPAPTCDYPEHVSGTNYAVGAIVRYKGLFYQATHANPGWDPVISTYFWSPYTCKASTTPTPTPTPTPAPIVSADRTAKSCGYADVSAAVNTASKGMTVAIPAGDCSWGTQQLNLPAGLHLQGAGQDKTTIRRVGAVSNTSYLVAIDCSNGAAAAFSGMTLIGNGNGAIQDKGLGLLNGCRDFRVYDSTFKNFVFSAVYVGDAANQRGVIYNNNFINNYSADLKNLGYGVVVYGGGAWPALDLGSANAVFVESNSFSGNRHNIASNNGSVYVFRYNKVVGTDAAKDYAMTDAHGVSSSPRGSRSYEIYNNDYSTNITGGLQRTAIGIRGGDGVIFNNTATATISRTIELMTEGFSCGAYAGADQIRSLYIWNNANNSSNGYTTNGIDNTCPSSIGLNRDYFLSAKPGYTPFTYPHPLRNAD
ncbi:hypothetical protein [Duganella guangzhouensis]|uniref:hypothetical protein n=1 Tax=Duganella guangzhouensis TaxID=2666084 RepID=UPI0018A212A2|nr:hypothetical protein [Duganella guangzhouensis]